MNADSCNASAASTRTKNRRTSALGEAPAEGSAAVETAAPEAGGAGAWANSGGVTVHNPRSSRSSRTMGTIRVRLDRRST